MIYEYFRNKLYASKKYEGQWDNVTLLRNKYKELSSPLLIFLKEGYISQKIRLLIVGQQTNGWSEGSIENLQNCYRDFKMGRNIFALHFGILCINSKKNSKSKEDVLCGLI